MLTEKLIKIAARLEEAEKPGNTEITKQRLGAVEKWILRAELAWSGSWLGYHSRVYYQELKAPPPEAKFSREWGLLYGEGVEGEGSVGDWQKYRKEDVIATIWDKAGKPNLLAVRHASSNAIKTLEAARTELNVHLAELTVPIGKDDILARLAEKVFDATVMKKEDFILKWTPGEVVPTRDEIALGEGLQTPPHLVVKADLWAIRHPFMVCGELAKTLRWMASRLQELANPASVPSPTPVAETAGVAPSPITPSPAAVPTAPLAAPKSRPPAPAICLGHGRSNEWKLVRDYVAGTLRRPWTEFNRVPVAGLSNVARLSEIFRQTCFAILVLTEEDLKIEGGREAELNLAHSAGLFQGRLGINRAVALIEEGCGDLRLLHDLPQIRFPKGNVIAAFSELQTLLEQEKIIQG